MSLQPSGAWLAAVVVVLAGAASLLALRRHLGAGEWEQVVARHQRWLSGGPIVLFTLVTYVVTSSVLIALIAAALLQWLLASTHQTRTPGTQPSRRGVAER